MTTETKPTTSYTTSSPTPTPTPTATANLIHNKNSYNNNKINNPKKNPKLDIPKKSPKFDKNDSPSSPLIVTSNFNDSPSSSSLKRRRSPRKKPIKTNYMVQMHSLFWKEEGENVDLNENKNKNDGDSDSHDEEKSKEEEKVMMLSFGKMKLFRIHHDPNVYIIENFLSEKELTYLNKVVGRMERQNRFQKSYIDVTAHCKKFDSSRTSRFIHFGKCENKIITDIESRASHLVGLSIDCVEPLQVVRYKPGQMFDDHHDLGVLFDDGSVELPSGSPRRICTFFLYLNDIPKGCGGCTRFPLLSDGYHDYLDVQPRRGLAVLWCNIRRNGMPDERMGMYP